MQLILQKLIINSLGCIIYSHPSKQTLCPVVMQQYSSFYYGLASLDHFTVVGLVDKPSIEIWGWGWPCFDETSLQCSLFSYGNYAWKVLVSIIPTSFTWESRKGCIKTRSTPALYPSISVKWLIKRETSMVEGSRVQASSVS